MNKRISIKPNQELLDSFDIKELKINELIFDSNGTSGTIDLEITNDKAIEEINKLESALKSKFGSTLALSFKPTFINEDIKKSYILNALQRIITDLKQNSATINLYLNFYEVTLEIDAVQLIIHEEFAFKKLINLNIKNEIMTLLKSRFDLELDVVLMQQSKPDLMAHFDQKLENHINMHMTQQNIVNKQESKEKNDEVLFGKKIVQKSIEIKDFDLLTIGDIAVFVGEIFNLDFIKTASGKVVLSCNITDHKAAITVKGFMKNQLAIKDGDWIKVRGRKQLDSFDITENILIATDIMKADKVEIKIEDNAEHKRVELHVHTKMTDLASIVDIDDLIKRAEGLGHKAVGIADSGVAYAFPQAYKRTKNSKDFKAILGIEGYLVDDTKKMIINPKDKPISEETYIVFDLETTGFDPRNDAIIEIGAVKVTNGLVTDKFSSFVDPERDIPAFITELTNITNEMVKGADKIDKALVKFLEFAGEATLVAHNASFDIGFVNQNMKRLNLVREHSVIDTLHWGRNIIKELTKYNLKALTKYFGIELENHHRALDDAEATAAVFLKLLSIVENRGIEKLTEIDKFFNVDVKHVFPHNTLIFVKNTEGLRNLYELISASHVDYYNRVPRIPKSLLQNKREGLIIASSFESGEILDSYLKGKDHEEILEIADFYDFIEIIPPSAGLAVIDSGYFKDETQVQAVIKELCSIGEALSIPVVATGNVHYLNDGDELFRRPLVYGKGNNDFSKDRGLYFRTTNEMLEEFSFLGQEKSFEVVVHNSNLIADMIEKIAPIPKGFYPPKLEGAEEYVRERTYAKAREVYGTPLPKIVEDRLVLELRSIIDNGFAVLYMIAQKLVEKSLNDGYLVGSRGSVGSSLVAWMMGITEVNALVPHYVCRDCKWSEFIEVTGCGVDLPEKSCPNCSSILHRDGHSISFEVFMGFNGDKIPDIDLNFSGEYQATIHRYVEELFHKDNVFRAGTITTLAKKNALGYVRKFTEENNIKLKKAEMERLAIKCENVRKTTGQHPGGMIVLPKDKSIYEFTPVQRPANDVNSEYLTTHFDYHVMDEQLVKLDILGHDDPTMLKLLEEYSSVPAVSVPLTDPQTLAIFSSTESLGVKSEEIGSLVGTYGIPEFGTPFVRNMLVETKPTKFAELARISGLSHGESVWSGNAQELIRGGTVSISQVISVRDDIINYLIDKGMDKKLSFDIMEFVRKGLPGKNKEAWGKFAEQMQEHGIEEWYINSCQKIAYMFPKGHAIAYVMMAMRVAYFKVHYPLAFYAAYFSRKLDAFDFEIMYYSDVNALSTRLKESAEKSWLDPKEKNELYLLEILREMHYRNIKLLPVDIYRSSARKFLLEDGMIRIPLMAINGLGESVAESIVLEREKSKFMSLEDLRRRTKLSQTLADKVKLYNLAQGLEDFNQKKLF